MSGILEVRDFSIVLKKDQTRIAGPLDFNIEAGGSLVILGQSGSGKTLTCKTILGVLGESFTPRGEIRFGGKELLTLPAKARREVYGEQIAMIAQNPMTAFDPSAKIGRQIDETLKLHTGHNRRIRRIICLNSLREAGLEQPEAVINDYPHRLSGGMLQRVMLAMALMLEVKLLVADEPTTALDARHRNAAVDSLIRQREQGTAVLLITHDFIVAKRFGGPMLVMKDGRIIERGSVEETLACPKHRYTREMLAASCLSGSEIGDEYICLR